ncbi:hypothetical protein MPH_08829 [Macrophomina phaseolina MS6]|uniref:LYR motif-containing protein Cup1-like N-terminal domain-containing protein n=1 Tax=Macrophomina phaseolina (strain MS6) TaxID=1126212 RepID=K2QWF2_MACPH|nr:hypothetical protein MPH_08829 [Macrophomina phaseolina MS6]
MRSGDGSRVRTRCASPIRDSRRLALHPSFPTSKATIPLHPHSSRVSPHSACTGVEPGFMITLSRADVSSARHLLRALLRECTYLPDPSARLYLHQHILRRFRHYHPPQHRDNGLNNLPTEPQFTAARLRGALKNAQKGLNFLRRANEGEAGPLQQLLFLTYGRSGRRRHDLMETLLVPDPISEREAVELWQAEVEATLDPSLSIQGIPKAVTEVPRQVGKPHRYEISPRYSKLRTLLESQRQSAHPVELRRAKLKSTYLEVPLHNIWMRPFPRKREKNLVKKWYASVLDKVLPPLPEGDWERLRDLVSGARRWEGLRRRRPGIPSHMSAYDVLKLANISGLAGDRFLALTCREHMLPETGSKAEMLSRLSTIASSRFQPADRWLSRGASDPAVLESLLQDSMETKQLPKQLPGKRRAQNITPRLMRRLWAKVFSQCPVLRWNEDKRAWTVEWGSWEHLQTSPKTLSLDTSFFGDTNAK